MFSLFTKQPKLEVIIEQNDIFLHPPATRGIDDPSEDPILRGEVLLTNDRPISLSSIRVSFQGHQDICAGQGAPTESYVCLQKDLDIQTNDEELQPGQHRWIFSFIVPSTTSPYQRCAFGRTRHFVEATAIVPGKLSSNIVARSKPIYLVVNPYPAGSPPESSEVTIQDILEDVGPVGITFQSNHLSIAAPVFIDFVLLHPPEGLEILSLKAFVVQNFEITYKNGRKVIPASQKHTIFELNAYERPSRPPGGAPSTQRTPSMARLGDALQSQGKSWSYAAPIEQPQPGEEWHYKQVARMPNDDKVRPSTLESTEDALRVEHGLVGEIRYKLAGQQTPKVITMISKAVKIVSCCCQFDDLVLPIYQRDRPVTKIDPRDCQCQCTASFQDLLDHDYFPLIALTQQTTNSSASSTSEGPPTPNSVPGTPAGEVPHWGSVTARVDRKVAADQPLGAEF